MKAQLLWDQLLWDSASLGSASLGLSFAGTAILEKPHADALAKRPSRAQASRHLHEGTRHDNEAISASKEEGKEPALFKLFNVAGPR